jgi:hypothetical protein
MKEETKLRYKECYISTFYNGRSLMNNNKKRVIIRRLALKREKKDENTKLRK